MSQVWLLFGAVCFFASISGTPINDGEDVGSVKTSGKVILVTGQREYPFLVHITTFFTKSKQRLKSNCAGVILGQNTVLTAAHCLHNKPNPKIFVHAGIVDAEFERNDGQRLLVEAYFKHEKFQSKCELANGRYCVGNNDIAILWTEDNFRFGLTIQKAVLNNKKAKPIGKEGWIMGWGLNGQNQQPSMLQRGSMKVLQKQECEFDGEVFLSKNVMCLGPVKRATRANRGDSGGPFVIAGVVYGLSSYTTFKEPLQADSRLLNVFTYVESYIPWINATLFNGAPQGKVKPKPTKCSNSKTCRFDN